MTLNPGLGPTRSRKLIEFFGSVEGVLNASLTSLEAAGLPVAKAVAVFGTGVDVLYPKENSRLAEQILSTNEFPLGTFAAPQNFPIRNGIISRMSFAVLVVEAAEYRGTRITARCALEQGRDVYAVPGNLTNKNSWGPNTLIKQGARLVATGRRMGGTPCRCATCADSAARV